MEWWIVGVLAFVVFGVVGLILKRMGNPAEEVPLERIPADARAEIDRIVPEFRPDRIRLTRNGSHAFLEGDHQGTRARVAAGTERAALYDVLARRSRTTEAYQRMCAPRELPLVVLEDRAAGDA